MPAFEGSDKYTKFEDILRVAKSKYGYIDILFQTNPELIKFLTDAVEQNWDAEEFKTRLTNTNWFLRINTTLLLLV